MDKGFVEYVLDLLSCHKGIAVRAMFGGHGVYKDGIIFAIIIESELYFKVGPSNINDYKQKDSCPFTYQGKDKQVSMPYWKVPEHIMEDQDMLDEWMQKSVKASIESKKGQPKK